MDLGFSINNLDLIISVSTLAFALYVFLRDPIRRWEFVGYLSKLIVVPIDLKSKEILFVNPKGKGYIAIYILVNKEDVLKNINL